MERAYQYVLADPKFRVGTRPSGPLSLEAKRFIVEMYERFTENGCWNEYGQNIGRLL